MAPWEHFLDIAMAGLKNKISNIVAFQIFLFYLKLRKTQVNGCKLTVNPIIVKLLFRE